MALIDDGISHTDLRAHLTAVLASRGFRASRRNAAFLTYVVEEYIADRPDRINGYRIGLEVFGRDTSFDPQTDPIVRTQAVRLRNALQRYYFEEGATAPWRITLPRGSYVPKIEPGGMPKKPAKPILAVLPFLDLSPGRDQDHLADGLAEDLALSLTGFTGFSVISSQSTQVFRAPGGDAREVARSLGASFIVRGTVRRNKKRVRVTAEVLDGETGEIVWGERFERDVTAGDLFDIQDAITRDVASKVADNYGVIPRRLSEATLSRRTENLSSYETLLLAYRYTNTGERSLHKKALAALEEAVRRDPGYAPAWAHLSELLSDDYAVWCHWDEALLERALEAANRAVVLNPQHQYCRFVKAYAHFFRRGAGDDEAFLEEAEAALTMVPQAAFVTGFTGFLLALFGRWKRGLDILERSKSLNPFHPGWFHVAPTILALSEDRPADAFREALKIQTPSLPWDPLLRGACQALLGEADGAGHAIEDLHELRPELEEPANRMRYLSTFIRDPHLAGRVDAALDNDARAHG